jgi:RNA polymerase sigma-70 factor (ECF subfamily)
MLTAASLEEHRAPLTGHCYRMLGSASDAEDAVQETLVRAWRGLERFDARASLRTWLYRIATNVCLDAISDRAKRVTPLESRPVGTIEDALEALPRSHWLEPVADARVLPAQVDPSELAVLRQSVRLAFVAALQHLPARQRAALLLAEVLGWSAAEIAECLETSLAAVNSALQRARATLAARGPGAELRPEPLTPTQTALVTRYVAAFEAYDVDGLVSLLREDATLSMPPYTLWLRGRDPIRSWLLGRGAGCRGSRLVPTAACGGPAFAQYRNGGREPWALITLELSEDCITGMTSFLDVETLFPLFGMQAALPGSPSQRFGGDR